MAVLPAGIDSLPNEVCVLSFLAFTVADSAKLFVQFLTSFSTRELLPLAAVSYRFHDIVLRLLHHRLVAAATLQDRNLVLECFHPSMRTSTPGLSCEYLGTAGLSDDIEGQGSLYAGLDRVGRLGKLAGLYSRFRPQEADNERKPRRRHPAGDVPGNPNTSSSQDVLDLPAIPSHTISLESHELFSQLCTNTIIVKVGPKRGLFLSAVTVGEGVIRVFRHWLAENATSPGSETPPIQRPSASNMDGTVIENPDKRTLWVDNGSNIGVRFRVIERQDLGSTPVLLGRDEDGPVTYTLEFEGLQWRPWERGAG